MTTRPSPPPEGQRITAALKRTKLSARRAAELAGISDARWRQITSGYQMVSGNPIPVRDAPAETVARMALVADVTPEELEEDDRPDAAGELRQLLADASRSQRGVLEADDPRLRILDAALETLTREQQVEFLRQELEERERGGRKAPRAPEERRRA
ncbi:hypothetical protein [Streptomyces aculeolatus]|uniref:hypothetical protein n=1 Tax=Streptomyces aculeolatus TaxID=270689 RepID=UPI001CEDCC0F|nr:hypothetical protein [Streptomyces aculeolatus]